MQWSTGANEILFVHTFFGFGISSVVARYVVDDMRLLRMVKTTMDHQELKKDVY